MRNRALLLPLLIGCLPLMLLAVNFKIDIITDINDINEYVIENDTLFAASTGGLIIMPLPDGPPRVYTTGDGFFSQSFTSITRDHRKTIILGTLDGMVGFLDLSTGTPVTDISLKGKEIVDLLAVDDTLWVLTRDLVAVYTYLPDLNRYQFIDFFENFGLSDITFSAVTRFQGHIWLGSDAGVFYAPSNYIKFNLKSASSWKRMTREDGLPSNRVRDLVASDSLLFMATAEGLVTYTNGNLSVTHAGLLTRNLYHVQVRENQVWVAEKYRIYQLQDGTFDLQFYHQQGFITNFFIDANGELSLSAVDRGIYFPQTNTRLFFDGPMDNFLGKIYIDRQGRLWCTSGKTDSDRQRGLFIKRSDGWYNLRFLGPGTWRNMSSTNSIMEDEQGNIWVGSWGGGITVFDPDLNFYPINNNSDSGRVWITTPQGEDTLKVIAPEAFRNLLAGVIPNPKYIVITDMLLDTERSSIWILNSEAVNRLPIVRFRGTAFDPVHIADKNNWQYFAQPLGGLHSDKLYRLTQDIFGDLWIATQRIGALQIRLKESGEMIFHQIAEVDNLKSNFTRSIAADQDGYVWIGTRLGLNAYLNGSLFDFREDYQPIGLQIEDIFVDSRNNKWFATNEGISILRAGGSPFDRSSWIHIVPMASDKAGDNVFYANLPSEAIHSIFVDEANGDVYVSTDAGLAIIRSNPFVGTFENLDRVSVGPNPFLVTEGGQERLYFYNLISGSHIKILTVDGQLVRTLDPDNFQEVQGGQAQWDGLNENGDPVASGIYVYLVTTEDGITTAGKILLIRK
ncbi:MAG: hypothetical protein GXO78_05450 [Calditrichaeota bacterium]|nr:hypothetical protein [Calditrichota bacterium]